MAANDKSRAFSRRIVVLTALLGMVTLLSAFATLHWFAELFSHFTPHYAVAGLIFSLSLAIAQRWRWMVFALLLTLWNGYPVARLLLQTAPAPDPAATRRFTVLHFNAHFQHPDMRRIATHIRRAKDVDVVALLEAGSQFDMLLSDIKEEFPHQIRHLEDSPFGIALASRHPIEYGVISREATPLYPHIEATIRMPGRTSPIAVYAVHAPPPINEEMARDRNTKLAHIARKVSSQPEMTPVVVGDFNLTPWSPYFMQFIGDSGLRDTRTPGRFEHTWPVTFNNAHLGLAVDHSLAHPALRPIKRIVGPDLGSDHMPVTVIFGY